MMKRPSLCALILALLSMPVLANGHYAAVAGGSFQSALVQEGHAQDRIVVAAFRMRTEPVTEGEFLAFVRHAPQWRQDRVAPLFAANGYLSHWAGPLMLGAGSTPTQPVTRISWFAARAYCASEGARLPHWMEWEYAAAADATRRDARDDAAWQARKLARLTSGFGGALEAASRDEPNAYGLYDMQAKVAEWVDDYAAMFVQADARNPGEANLLSLCGGAAAAFADRTDYTLMMRVATLAALSPADSSGNVGFRCAKDD